MNTFVNRLEAESVDTVNIAMRLERTFKELERGQIAEDEYVKRTKELIPQLWEAVVTQNKLRG